MLGNIMNLYSMSLTMTRDCVDKDGAWEFIRTFLTEDWQRENLSRLLFPTNMTVFYEKAEDSMTPIFETNANGEKIEVPKYSRYIYDIDTHFDLYAITQAEVDQVIEMINTASFMSDLWDTNLYSIVYDEAIAFFNGTKIAEETAHIIQRRASIYLSEQMR